jgi:hypothetical protein
MEKIYYLKWDVKTVANPYARMEIEVKKTINLYMCMQRYTIIITLDKLGLVPIHIQLCLQMISQTIFPIMKIAFLSLILQQPQKDLLSMLNSCTVDCI